MALKRSADRKVTPIMTVKRAAGVNSQGKRFEADATVKVKNAFGLPAHETCPGETTFCEGCYAAKSERVFTNAGRLVAHNLAELEAAGTISAMRDLLDAMVQDFKAECDKRGAAKVFRIHWDGDFYSVEYAEAWRQTMGRHQDVRFWAYTRSFVRGCNVVPILANVENLTLYLSVDKYNAALATKVALKHPQVLIAACDETMADASAVLGGMNRGRAPACPENTKKLALVMPLDRRGTLATGDTAQGACVACQLCINGTADVRFSIKKGR